MQSAIATKQPRALPPLSRAGWAFVEAQGVELGTRAWLQLRTLAKRQMKKREFPNGHVFTLVQPTLRENEVAVTMFMTESAVGVALVLSDATPMNLVLELDKFPIEGVSDDDYRSILRAFGLEDAG